MRLAAAIVLGALAIAGVARPCADQRTPISDPFAAADALLDAAVPKIGGSVLWVWKDGRVAHRRAFGGFNADTRVPIASASKWLSAAVIMALVDRGTLALDDPARRYVPTLAGDKAAITIRQLMSHTSGLPADMPCLNIRRITLEACANEIASVPLLAPPGTRFRYGGASMQIAGRAAEVAAGRPWRDLFADLVATPAGLTETTFEGLFDTENPRIAGGAFSTADDYGAFLTMILNGGTIGGRRVLSERAIEEMQRDQTGGVPLASTPYASFAALDTSLPQTRYGIGEWLERLDPATRRGIEVSCQGAFGFSPWIDRERRIAMVLVVRSTLARAMPIYLDLKRSVARAP